ncbi:hypothetical protein, partial [Vibrio sp. 10N.222.49.C9]|uniref:hypothetical protein n=1 Tax=Vibrio sp. 10N.222.49.C9 TaxID=3229615 RepID=UPI00354B44CE
AEHSLAKMLRSVKANLRTHHFSDCFKQSNQQHLLSNHDGPCKLIRSFHINENFEVVTFLASKTNTVNLREFLDAHSEVHEAELALTC